MVRWTRPAIGESPGLVAPAVVKRIMASGAALLRIVWTPAPISAVAVATLLAAAALWGTAGFMEMVAAFVPCGQPRDWLSHCTESVFALRAAIAERRSRTAVATIWDPTSRGKRHPGRLHPPGATAEVTLP